MSWVNGLAADDWIGENHPENGLFKVYWKDVVSLLPLEGDATFDENEGEGLRWEWNYKDGKRADGVSRGWHYNSDQLKDERTYKDGELDGLWTVWGRNGNAQRSVNYKNGKRDGLWTIWDENSGQKRDELTYKDGNPDGSFTSWYSNGQKILELFFEDGKKDGLLIWYGENGQKQTQNVVVKVVGGSTNYEASGSNIITAFMVHAGTNYRLYPANGDETIAPELGSKPLAMNEIHQLELKKVETGNSTVVTLILKDE